MNRAHAALWLATWGGAGYFPIGPGTAGSIAAVLIAYICYAVWGVAPVWFGLAAAVLAPLAVWSSGEAETCLGSGDPPQVVIDEVVGQWIALVTVLPGAWWSWLGALILFRIFDIAKPWPISRLELIPGGYGVVADDAAAGLYVMIIGAVIHRFAG